MDRRLGRQIGDRRDTFSRQSFFLLAMATKTVAAWSALIYMFTNGWVFLWYSNQYYSHQLICICRVVSIPWFRNFP